MGATDQSIDRLSRDEIQCLFENFSDADWVRAEKSARILVRGLVGISWEDILQESITKLLSGERSLPRHVIPMIALQNIMHSEASNYRKSFRSSGIDAKVVVTEEELPGSQTVMPINQISPERIVAASDELNHIYDVLENDPELQMVAMAWADGLRGAEAADAAGLDAQSYDAARKRLGRKLDALAVEGKRS